MRRIITAVAVAAVGVAALALPAVAATPASFSGTVGPGFTISMKTKPKKAGTITLVVSDKAGIHNFHLLAPGGKQVAGVIKQKGKKDKAVKSIATSVGATGTTTFGLTLKAGTYTFVCDPHDSSMKGSFTVK